MRNNNKIIIDFEIAITENEKHLKMKLDQYKAETSSSIKMKLLTSN